MEERKGFLTPEQEKILDGIIKFKNPLAESLDGPAILLLDNIVLEKLKAEFAEKNPEAIELAYQVVDVIFASLGKE